MAEAGHQAFSLGGGVSLEPTSCAPSFFDTCTTSTLGKIEPKEEHSASPPTKEMNLSSLTASAEPTEQEQSPSKHCVVPKVSSLPQSLSELHTSSQQVNTAMNSTSNNPEADRMVQSVKTAALPVYRSHSDASPLAPHAAETKIGGLAWHGGDKSIQEAESRSMVSCKQPIQLQRCNIVTSVCRGASGGEVGAQHCQSRCIYSLPPKAAFRVEDQLNPNCDKVLCYGSFIHHANFEDTFAAYCHPQPIPASSQLLPHLASVQPSCDVQRAAALPTATNHLSLPRLISSISETGLDGKHLLRCCSLSCSFMSPPPPGTATQIPNHFIGEESCSCAAALARAMTQDVGTMTTHKEQRDVGVQTGESERVTPHVFPHICLAAETPNTDNDLGKKQFGAPKSPVKEVKWDAEGMTWEVYGASVDPEELGLAIQRHLELQIKETASRAAKLSRQHTNTSQQSSSTGCHKKRSRIIRSIQSPACCASATTAVD